MRACQQREGIFFNDNDTEKMLRIIMSGQVQISITEVRICLRVVPKSVKSSAKTGPNHGGFKMVMEKSSQTEIRFRYLHQTDFSRRSPRSQKTRNSKGFCEDNLPQQMSEQNSQREGRDRHCFQFRYTPLPCRQTILICLPKSMMVAVLSRAPRQSQNQTHNSNKKRMLPGKAASS